MYLSSDFYLSGDVAHRVYDFQLYFHLCFFVFVIVAFVLLSNDSFLEFILSRLQGFIHLRGGALFPSY